MPVVYKWVKCYGIRPHENPTRVSALTVIDDHGCFSYEAKGLISRKRWLFGVAKDVGRPFRYDKGYTTQFPFRAPGFAFDEKYHAMIFWHEHLSPSGSNPIPDVIWFELWRAWAEILGYDDLIARGILVDWKVPSGTVVCDSIKLLELVDRKD